MCMITFPFLFDLWFSWTNTDFVCLVFFEFLSILKLFPSGLILLFSVISDAFGILALSPLHGTLSHSLVWPQFWQMSWGHQHSWHRGFSLISVLGDPSHLCSFLDPVSWVLGLHLRFGGAALVGDRRGAGRDQTLRPYMDQNVFSLPWWPHYLVTSSGAAEKTHTVDSFFLFPLILYLLYETDLLSLETCRMSFLPSWSAISQWCA